MALNLINRQRKVRFLVNMVRPLMLKAMALAGLGEEDEVTVMFVSDRRIQELNEQWRGIDQPTDCLSFPMQGAEPDPLGQTYLGDIVISVQAAKRQGEVYFPELDERDALIREVIVLFVHSLLHLLGHDHIQPGERGLMTAQEERILTALFPHASVQGLTQR